MGNAFDRIINKGPPFSPRCVPECTPGPYDLRGNICYKGKCVSLCPVNSIATEDGKCLCTEDNAKFIDSNTKMKNKPLEGDGWGYCSDATLEKKFKPEYLFIDRVPKELDERVKVIVKKELKKNPNMSDKELKDLISKTTIDVIEELAVECKDEYKVVKMILSPSYGNGQWPTKEKLRVLIDTKDFPWLKSQVDKWPEQKDITSCKILSVVKDIISINNGCMYTDEYPDIKEECNVECGLGVEVRKKRIIKKPNIDFPSLQPCQSIPPIKEFECDSGVVCKEDCKIVMNTESYTSARCSKPCDSGDGPGKITYKVKYVKASQGEPGDKGSCELDERGKIEGKEYEITTDCNKEKCPDCEIESKGPYKDNLVDYTGSIVDGNGNNKTYTKCLLPKEDGSFEPMDCGSAVGGHNYYKGARAKYNVSYKITEDAYGVQSCTKGEDVVEEGCPVNAFDTELNPIVGSDGKLLKGGGEECENQCILSDDYPEVVPVKSSDGKLVECTKTCGGGIKRMRQIVKSKRNAKYCPCGDDPNKCDFKEVPCNTQDCIKDCVYRDEQDPKHVQINDPCPGAEGINEHVVWDTEKINSKGEEGMWYDEKNGKFYERNHFVKKMRVPTKEPIIGKGKCHQGTKADFTLPCPIKDNKRPIDAVWGDWEHDGTYRGWGDTLSEISEEHSTWDVEGNPNFGKKGEHCVKEDKLASATEENLPGKNMIRRIQKRSQYGGQIFSTIQQHDEGAIRKTVDYMIKDDGSGYTKYCPEDVSLFPDGAWDTEDFDFNQEKCYQPNNPESRKKYTEEELEKESKRSFLRNSALPEYDTLRGGKKTRIVKPGSRTIYQYKAKDELPGFPAKYGGFTPGKWHKTSKGYPSTQDKRLFEYNECPGVHEVLQKIRDNNPTWKSNSMIEQKSCEPVYNWDGKFYTNQAAAEAGSTDEQIITHSGSTGRKELPKELKKGDPGYEYPGDQNKRPGVNIRTTDDGKFLTNYMHTSSICQKPGLDDTAWCGNKSTHDYIQMITESGKIELVKGVVTKGKKRRHEWVTEFEVYVSRNGDSWKQVKNASGSTTFIGNSEAARGETKVENYFNEIVEAKYIRFVTKKWHRWNSMRIGYIRDNSGVVNCIGESGMTKGNPWFRFTFNTEKTKLHGEYSEGTAETTKTCPNEGAVMIAEKKPEGIVYSTEFDVDTIKVFKDDKANFVKAYMPKQTIKGCGVDPSSSGWYSSLTGGSKTWSECVKPDANGLRTPLPKEGDAFNLEDKGYKYMFRHWSGSNNDNIYGEGNGYNQLVDDSIPYASNAHPSSANNGSTYNKIPTTFDVKNYESSNIIRQPCNRGRKGQVPSLSTKNWVSTIPSSANEQVGYKGTVWNLENGIEGWIDGIKKFTWNNKFNGRIAALVGNEMYNDSINHYKIVEMQGTKPDPNSSIQDDRVASATRIHSRSQPLINFNNFRLPAKFEFFVDIKKWDGTKGEGGHIGGNQAYHSQGTDLRTWNTSLDNDNACAKYEENQKFYPVGIRIQPSGITPNIHKSYRPTKIRLSFDKNIPPIDVTLGEFRNRNDIKTILIDPLKRKLTKKFYVYSRHGLNYPSVAFRINYIIGRPGKGYSVDKGSNKIKNGNKEPVDCTLGEWSDWSDCPTEDAGRGCTDDNKRSRTRAINPPQYGGRNDCGDKTLDEETCAKICDCSGKWTDAEYDSSCGKDSTEYKKEKGCSYSRTCNNGYVRSYSISQKKVGSGKACPNKHRDTKCETGNKSCGSWKKGQCDVIDKGVHVAKKVTNTFLGFRLF